MHLLAADAQRIDDGEDAIDLDLAPAPVVVLSAADGEITALSQAVHRAPDGVAVRLASLSALSHPMSVDSLAEKTLCHARVIAVRVLGGEGYFAYGIETVRRVAARTGAKLLIVPGEPAFDEALSSRGTVPLEDARAFHALCREAGPDNRDRAISLLRALADDAPLPPPAVSVPSAGLYLRGRVPDTLDALSAMVPEGPAVGLVFYRAHLLDGLTGGIDALVEGLVEAGLKPVPVFASSLKDPVAGAVVRALLDEAGATVAITTMAFSAGGAGGPLDGHHRVVLEAVQAGSGIAEWADRTAGLGVRDLAMSVVTTEFDGRVLSRAFAFKTRKERDALTGAFPIDYAPVPDRVRFVAALARAHADLKRTPAADKRVALVLANYPGKEGRIANGVGLDTPASTINIIMALREAGYRIADAPQDGGALMNCLRAGRAAPPAWLPLQRYREWLATLPEAARAALRAQWGEPEDDPACEGDRIAVPVHAFGNVVVGVQPTRGYERNARETYHDPDLVPTHAYLAFTCICGTCLQPTPWSTWASTATWNGCPARRWRYRRPAGRRSPSDRHPTSTPSS